MIKPGGYYNLNETSINRILSHGAHGMIIISANRSGIVSDKAECSLVNEYKKWLSENHLEDTSDTQEQYLIERNRKADADLLKDIRHMGYAYSKVYGGYHPTSGDQPDSYEPSYIVYNHEAGDHNFYSDFEYLKQFAIQMCEKYKQDSVYVQAPNELPVYYDMHGNVVGKAQSSDIKVNRDEEYFTTIKRKKDAPKFTADIVFESILASKPADRHNQRRRQQYGEVFLLS